MLAVNGYLCDALRVARHERAVEADGRRFCCGAAAEQRQPARPRRICDGGTRAERERKDSDRPNVARADGRTDGVEPNSEGIHSVRAFLSTVTYTKPIPNPVVPQAVVLEVLG
jgi:hypothetical protein